MKKYVLIVLVICIFFSCQNEQEDLRVDWVQEMDKTISEYNKTAEVEKVFDIEEYGFISKVRFFKTNSEGLQKIQIESKSDYSYRASALAYTMKNDVVYHKLEGLFPLLYKARKKDSDPCCNMMGKTVYFKSPDEGKEYIKNLNLIKIDAKSIDYKSKIEELRAMPFEEVEIHDIQDSYNRLLNMIDELKVKKNKQ